MSTITSRPRNLITHRHVAVVDSRRFPGRTNERKRNDNDRPRQKTDGRVVPLCWQGGERKPGFSGAPSSACAVTGGTPCERSHRGDAGAPDRPPVARRRRRRRDSGTRRVARPGRQEGRVERASRDALAPRCGGHRQPKGPVRRPTRPPNRGSSETAQRPSPAPARSNPNSRRGGRTRPPVSPDTRLPDQSPRSFSPDRQSSLSVPRPPTPLPSRRRPPEAGNGRSVSSSSLIGGRVLVEPSQGRLDTPAREE